jgi:hypothetical protein
MGFGGFSWWLDENAAEVGNVMQTITSNATIGSCLTACNSAGACAAVKLDGYDAAARSVTSCSLLAGVVSNFNYERTLVRTRVAGVVYGL